jgi:hypothetical protein
MSEPWRMKFLNTCNFSCKLFTDYYLKFCFPSYIQQVIHKGTIHPNSMLLLCLGETSLHFRIWIESLFDLKQTCTVCTCRGVIVHNQKTMDEFAKSCIVAEYLYDQILNTLKGSRSSPLQISTNDKCPVCEITWSRCFLLVYRII